MQCSKNIPSIVEDLFTDNRCLHLALAKFQYYHEDIW